MMRYWVNTVSRDDVQAGHAGESPRLKRASKGDVVVFYSPRTGIRSGEPVQSFTGIAEVIEESPYQAKFIAATEAPVRPLIESLDFITNKKSWGVTFRRSFFEIGESDFQKIAAAMSAYNRDRGEHDPVAASGPAGS
ncbi:MAG TPA: EVE domain-containing protein [Thermoanaerobaculia bacterium]|nr:EVE domain-containing protein [Thermoanaerobaculia bacterium]